MRILTFSEFLAVSELTDQLLKTLRRRHQLALAFGRREAFASLSYVEIDAVAVLLTSELAKSFDRTFAARLVRVHCDTWAKAVSYAEASKDARFFSVVEALNPAKRPSHMVVQTGFANSLEAMDAIGAQLHSEGFKPLRVVATNITDIIERVRTNAAKAKIDLRKPFLPSDPQLREILSSYSEARDRAVAAVKSGVDQEDIARRCGLLARAIVEAGIPTTTNHANRGAKRR